jgi:hypothetical protein
MRPIALVAAAVTLGMAVTSTAQETRPAEQQGPPRFSLTVYSSADPATFEPRRYAQQRRSSGYYSGQDLPGYGVVREVRPVELQQGVNHLRFTDVAGGIDPTTVSFRSLTAPDTTAVVEQNYEYDLVSAEKLMEKSVGKRIVVKRQAGDGEEAVEGFLLSVGDTYGRGGPVLLTDGGIRLIQGVQDVALAGDTSGLVTKPTLVWTVSAEQAGHHDVQVGYQTDGLTWRADYNLLVAADHSRVDVSAWVTLMNESGASYPDARLKLVAGDVQRLRPPERVYFRGGGGGGSGSTDEGFQERAFFEYHLYTLGRTTSLPDKSTKQIELFPPKPGVKAGKVYVYNGLPDPWQYVQHEYGPHTDRNIGVLSNPKVGVHLVLSNSLANGLGIPLPAGRIRAYTRDDADGTLEFVGEDVIKHTPKDEQVMVRLGSAFDIVGERRQTAFSVDNNEDHLTESFEIKLRNHKDEPVRVIVKENLYRWMNWEITERSHPFEKQDYRTIHIPVDVEPDGETVVTYTVRYTW